MIVDLIHKYRKHLLSIEDFADKSSLNIDTAKIILEDFEISIKKDCSNMNNLEHIEELNNFFDFSKINFAGFSSTNQIFLIDSIRVFGTFQDTYIGQDYKDNRIYLCESLCKGELVAENLAQYIEIVLIFANYSIKRFTNEINQELKEDTIEKIKSCLVKPELSKRFTAMIPINT
jgi:hypothetical protein